MAFGEAASQEVRLVGKLAPVAKLRVSTISPPGPDVMILQAEDGRPSGVRITEVGVQVGHVAGQVTLTTGVEAPRELTLLYSWNVSGNLTVDPTNPFLDLRAPAPGVVVRVKSSRKDFRLTAAEIPAGPFVASVENAGDEYAVRVNATAARGASADGRGFLGKLRLVSNDPAEPIKDVPLFALGPLPHQVTERPR